MGSGGRGPGGGRKGPYAGGCGRWRGRQLLRAGIALDTLHNVALTHMHWDHILGYPAFVWGSWNAGRLKLDVTGPLGTEAMHEQLVESY